MKASQYLNVFLPLNDVLFTMASFKYDKRSAKQKHSLSDISATDKLYRTLHFLRISTLVSLRHRSNLILQKDSSSLTLSSSRYYWKMYVLKFNFFLPVHARGNKWIWLGRKLHFQWDFLFRKLVSLYYFYISSQKNRSTYGTKQYFEYDRL